MAKSENARTLVATPLAPQKLAHVVLRVNDFEAAKDWFCRVLNAQVVFGNKMVAFLTYDEEHHRVALLNTPGLPTGDRTTTGLEHVAFTYASLGDLLSTYVRLKGEGVTPNWCINHGPTTSIYYPAPGGANVELQVENFDTLEDLMTWFATGAFTHNPSSDAFDSKRFAREAIGVEFDPDELVRLYLAGESEVDLKRQGAAAREPAEHGL